MKPLMWLGLAFYSLSCCVVGCCSLPALLRLVLCLLAIFPLLHFYRALQWQGQWHGLFLGREGRVILYPHNAESHVARMIFVRAYLGFILVLGLNNGRNLYVLLPLLSQPSRWRARRLTREYAHLA